MTTSEKKDRRLDRIAGTLITVFAAAFLIIATVTISNHFTGQSNHAQGTVEIQVLQEQRDFAGWLIAATNINHTTVCKVAAQRHITCPPLPPLPADVLGLGTQKAAH